jgi:hypothetical protein
MMVVLLRQLLVVQVLVVAVLVALVEIFHQELVVLDYQTVKLAAC